MDAKLKSQTYPPMKKRRKPKTSKKRNRRTGEVKETMFRAGISFGGAMACDTSKTLLETSLDDTLAIDYAIFTNYTFPFENLVLEGGGMKGLGYIGAFQVLEEANILSQIKRVAGVSIGSVLATLLICGYSPLELQDVMMEDLNHITIDHKCGICSLLPNVKRKFGWNPGKRLRKWIDEKIKMKFGVNNLTFRQLYERTGRELCIVVTNLSEMNVDYFHPKLTPNTAIADAVRMSTAIPGMFQASISERDDGSKDVFVDGGLLCNYPIHAYDGWWLSMKPEDSLFKRLSTLDDCTKLLTKNERFSPWNEATLGIVVFAEDEAEIMKSKFRERKGSSVPQTPQTKVAKNRKNLKLRENRNGFENENVKNSMDKLLTALQDIDCLNPCGVPLNDFKSALARSNLTANDYHVLFGGKNLNEIIEEINKDNDDEITYKELITFIEKKGIDLTSKFLGYTRRNINNFTDFLSAIESTLAVSLMKNNVDDRDSTRTIGINTGYVGTTDFDIEEEDRKFVIECGARATRAFLREYCHQHPERRKSDFGVISECLFRNRGRNEKTERFKKLVGRLARSASKLDKTDFMERRMRSMIVTTSSNSMTSIEEEKGDVTDGDDNVFTMEDALRNELMQIRLKGLEDVDSVPGSPNNNEKSFNKNECIVIENKDTV